VVVKRFPLIATALSFSMLFGPVDAGESRSSRYVPLTLLAEHAHSVYTDLLDAHHASLDARDDRVSDCLRDLGDYASELDSDFGELSDVGVLSDRMRARSDSFEVQRVLRIKATSTIKIIDRLRTAVSSTMGYCGSDPVVATKAQVILDFMQTAKDKLNDPALGLAP
jgi:hypothetical protein